jgi:hypothetical protein
MAEKSEGQAHNNGAAHAKPAQKISKMEAMRRSLAKLGSDAANKDIQADLRKRFGVEMTLDHISNYKSELRKKTRAASTSPATVKAAPPVKAAPAAKAAGKALRLEDVLTVKALVERVGGDQLRTLIAAFER